MKITKWILAVAILASTFIGGLSQVASKDSLSVDKTYFLQLNRWKRFMWVDSLEIRKRTDDYQIDGWVGMARYNTGSAILEFHVDTLGVPLVFQCVEIGYNDMYDTDVYHCIDIDATRDSTVYQIEMNTEMFVVKHDYDDFNGLYKYQDIMYYDRRLDKEQISPDKNKTEK